MDRLSEPVREGKVKSVSNLIRAALEHYNLSNLVVVRPAQLTISVRLPAELRRTLRHTARAKGTSVGQIVRAAVEAYLPEIESQVAGQLEMQIAPEPATVSAAAAPARRRRARGRQPLPVPRKRARTMTRKRAKG